MGAGARCAEQLQHRIGGMSEEALERPLESRKLRVTLVGILQLGVDESEELLALGLVGDALDDVRGLHHEREIEARMLAEATLVTQERVELLVVDVAAVAALVGVVATVLADAMLVGHRAAAAWALQLLRGCAALVEGGVLDEQIGRDHRNGEVEAYLRLRRLYRESLDELPQL